MFLVEGQDKGYDCGGYRRGVVAALEDAGYMQSTIGQIRKSIRWLGVLAEKQSGVYTSVGCRIRLDDNEPADRQVQFSAPYGLQPVGVVV